MKVLVTGGSGQLGTHVLTRLAGWRKVKQVVSLDLRPPMVASAKIRAVTGDVRDPQIARHFDGCDAVVHLAFCLTAFPPREVMDAINVGGSKNVFRAAAAAGVKQVVYSSSVAAYGVTGGHPEPLVEDSPRVHVPDFAYSANKFEVEAFLDELEREHPALKIVRLRPAILIGARMEHGLGRALKARLLPGSGDTPVPLVWDEDVADAVLLALQQGAHGAYNLCAGECLPAAELGRRTGLRVINVPAVVRRVLPALMRLPGKRPKTDPAWLRSSGARMVMSCEKARRELGWAPRQDTATDVIRHYLATVPRRPDARVALFFRMLDLAARRAPVAEEARHVSACVHLILTGPGGGEFGLRVDGGRASVCKPPRPPGSVVTMPTSLFLELLAGRGDFQTAQMTGRIRTQGDPVAAMVLQGMFTTFQAATRRPGAVGLAARGLSRWFGRGEASP